MKIYNKIEIFFLLPLFISCSSSSLKMDATNFSNCSRETCDSIAMTKISRTYKLKNIDSLRLLTIKTETDSTYNFYYYNRSNLTKGGDIYISIFKSNCRINFKDSYSGQ